MIQLNPDGALWLRLLMERQKALICIYINHCLLLIQSWSQRERWSLILLLLLLLLLLLINIISLFCFACASRSHLIPEISIMSKEDQVKNYGEIFADPDDLVETPSDTMKIWQTEGTPFIVSRMSSISAALSLETPLMYSRTSSIEWDEDDNNNEGLREASPSDSGDSNHGGKDLLADGDEDNDLDDDMNVLPPPPLFSDDEPSVSILIPFQSHFGHKNHHKHNRNRDGDEDNDLDDDLNVLTEAIYEGLPRKRNSISKLSKSMTGSRSQATIKKLLLESVIKSSGSAMAERPVSVGSGRCKAVQSKIAGVKKMHQIPQFADDDHSNDLLAEDDLNILMEAIYEGLPRKRNPISKLSKSMTSSRSQATSKKLLLESVVKSSGSAMAERPVSVVSGHFKAVKDQMACVKLSEDNKEIMPSYLETDIDSIINYERFIENHNENLIKSNR